MKRLAILFLLLSGLCAHAQSGLSERVFLMTDRQVYLAGDRIWCSAFCFDAATGGLSDFSSIAYMELHSATTMVATGKVALMGGRGGADIMIPSNLPTGNYVLLAYTAQNCNEDGFDYMTGARTISIFNTASTERVSDGVEIVPASEYKPTAPASAAGSVTVTAPAVALQGSTAVVKVANAGKDASVSVSVRLEDGITAPATLGAGEFLASLKPGKSFSQNRIPEFEGEIIRGRIAGLNPAQADSLYAKSGFISAPGNKSDVYSSPIRKNAELTFFTNSIYGDKDLVCEIEGIDSEVPCHIELESPFVNASVGEIPVLQLTDGLRGRLEKRTVCSRIEKNFFGELIPDRLPVRENALFGQEAITYRLDDYTRFPTMEEIIVEFIQELRIRRNDDRRREIQVRLYDKHNSSHYSNGSSLIMIDGIPVFDCDRVLDYDPLLIETVSIYPYTYFVGFRSFEGIVNLETYKGNMPGVTFEPNVRIVDFKGCSYPMSYTGTNTRDAYPDYRQTAYWHPLVDLPEGGELSLDVKLPEYPGTFVIDVEGFDSQGNPVVYQTSFEVK